MEPNFGSGNQLLGGANDALSQAIARRQSGQGGATQQVSPSAPTFDPNSVTPQITAQTPGSPSVPNTSSPMAEPVDQTEAKIILKALTKRLSDIGSIQKQGGQV